MELEIPNKLFDRNLNDVEVGLSEIHLYLQEEMEEAQAGYRYNGLTGEIIADWIGDEYIIIGNDSCCGDPIITKIDEEELPVYSMFHDDWDTLELIAESFEQYIELLEKIEEIDLESKDNCQEFLKEIKEQYQGVSYNYWEGLITAAYEFLTDEDY